MPADIEATKRAIAARLTSDDFSTLLDTIDQEQATGLTTPLPAAVFEGEKMVGIDALGYPVGEVVGIKTTYPSGSGSSAGIPMGAIAPNEAKIAQHEIDVIWTHVGDDELTITAQLERLVRATRDLFWNVNLTDVGSAPVLIVAEDYSQLMSKKPPQPFVKASFTRMLVVTFAV